jgi:hypothetical protein
MAKRMVQSRSAQARGTTAGSPGIAADSALDENLFTQLGGTTDTSTGAPAQ